MLHSVRGSNATVRFQKCKQSRPSEMTIMSVLNSTQFLPLFLDSKPCPNVLSWIFSARPHSHPDGNHILQTSCTTAATVTSPGMNKSTCAGFGMVIPGAAGRGVCTPRERPSFSTRRPAGGWGGGWRASASASSSGGPRSWPQLRQRPEGQP